MPFEIIWADSAARQLGGLDLTVARRIFEKVGELRENPMGASRSWSTRRTTG